MPPQAAKSRQAGWKRAVLEAGWKRIRAPLRIVHARDRAVLLDLQALPPLGESTAWFAMPRFTRSIGAVERRWMLERSSVMRGWAKYVPREAFDYLLVLPGTRPVDFWSGSSGARVSGAEGASAAEGVGANDQAG